MAAAAFDLPLVVQAVVFLAVSVGGVLGVRPRLVRRRSARLVSGAQAMIGETAVVQDRIEGTVPGHVRLGGEQWLAITGEGISLEPGTDVMVVDIEGTKLVVARR